MSSSGQDRSNEVRSTLETRREPNARAIALIKRVEEICTGESVERRAVDLR
jgi:hypothetical protein